MNFFDVFAKVLENAIEFMHRPPFSYIVMVVIFLMLISSVARIVLRLVDLGSVEHQDQNDEEESELTDDDDDDDINWYISADDFTFEDRDEF